MAIRHVVTRFHRARPLVAAALAVSSVFTGAICAWGLVETVSLPDQKPLLGSILSVMTCLAAIAFGGGAWWLAHAEVQAQEARDGIERVMNTSLHGFEVFQAMRDSGGRITDFRLTFANNAVSKIMGRDYAEFVGRPLQECEGAGFEDLLEKFRLVVESGESVSLERQYQNEDQILWLDGRAAKFDDGVVCTITDVTERQRAQEKARNDQKLMEITGHMTRAGGWEILLPEQIIKWSKEVYDIHEVPLDFDPNLNQAVEFYPPGSRERISQAVAECVNEGTPFDLELEFLTGRGRALWIHTIGRPDIDEDGILRRVYGSFQDITAYKLATLQALESKEQLQLALSGTAMGRWDWDIATGRLQLDEGAARILGYDLAEMIPTVDHWNALIHPEDFPGVIEAVRKHLDGTAAFLEAEYRMRSKGGEWIWVLDRGKAMDTGEGHATRVVGTLLDITDKKTLEKERGDHLKVLERITSQAPGALYQYRVAPDGKHSFVYASRRIINVYDRTPEELMADVGRGYDLIHPDDVARIRESAEKADAPESELRLEFRIYRKGELRWIRDQSSAEVLPDGSILWHGFLMDVTWQKILDQQLMQAKDEAEAAGRAKAEFLAMMSHEIRTPMNAILGFADLLSQKLLSGQERDYVHTITSSGEALLRIIDDILDHSRIESGRLSLENTLFSPGKLLDDISSLLAPAAEKKGLGLEVITVGDIPSVVEGDAGRLRQILLNLAGNAVKFTPFGTVALGLESIAGDARPGQVNMRFFVRDAGPGIPPEQAAHIFQPFAQGDSSVSRRHGGTGLGLAISRSLATLMGGVLWFETTPEAGSTFLLEVPFRLPKENVLIESPPAEILETGFAMKHPLRILAVDDDEMNLKLIAHVLDKLGYSPRVARSGKETIEACRREWPQCVLIDVQMPGLDGLEATRLLREIESSENRPYLFITALTANVLTGERQACFAAGMSDYLTKPLRRDLLAQMLVRASHETATLETSHLS